MFFASLDSFTEKTLLVTTVGIARDLNNWVFGQYPNNELKTKISPGFFNLPLLINILRFRARDTHSIHH